MSTHTPGPWYIYPVIFNDFWSIKKGKTTVATCYAGNDRTTQGKIGKLNSNAILITAAPDMFDALVMIQNALISGSQDEFNDAVCHVSTAINKATGHVL